MPDCFVRSGILELMVMVVNLVFDNHPFHLRWQDGEHKDAGGKPELAQEPHRRFAAQSRC